MAVEQVATSAPATGRGGREISGLGLRLVLGAGAFGLVLVTLVSAQGARFGAVPVVLALVAAVAVAGFPASPAAMAVSTIVIALYATSVSEFGLAAVVVGSLLHTVHVLAGLAEVIPARSRVEMPALLPTFRRWRRVQLLTVPVLAILTPFL